MNIKVIDNFLFENDLQEISSLKLNRAKDYEIKVYHNSIYKDDLTKSSCLKVETIKRLQSLYHNKAIKILKELYPEKVRLYKYSEFHIIETGSNYKFPIHDDTPNKLLSGVVYISPEDNKGTMFYSDKKGNDEKIIEWKKNRAVFFARKERETWHSYEGDKKSNRTALVYNLMTENIKEVCEIENKNFLYSYLRFKLNPFLYRYFKILI